METERPFLNVSASVTGRRWAGPGREVERQALGMAQVLDLPEIVARVLAGRGITAEHAPAYLDPKLRDLMPDPSILADMDRAAERLASAVIKGQRVAIFGDYDVDGAASVELLRAWLAQFGLMATTYIPDRIDEGYGPNEPAMTDLGRAHDLILCVDCGTLSHAPIAAARAAGADVIIADHHLAGETLPDAIAIVNPNRHDDRSGLGYLCAAGVVFLLLVATNRHLRQSHAPVGRKVPDLMSMLDLVALATVADVAPLTGLNRALVRQGLKVLSARQRPGLAALADAARLTAPPTAWDLGFALGPRLNAGGRVGQASLGIRLLAAETVEIAAPLAQELDRLNTARREIEAMVLEAATAQVEARGVDAPLIWAAGEGWHPGVVGIVASRLKERFNRPAVVIGLDADGGKGSGRSTKGIDLGSAVAALARSGLLLKGGGHAVAAGLTVARDQIEPAMQSLSERLAQQGSGLEGARTFRIDGALAPGGATPELVSALEAAGPFGQANPAPRLAFAKVVPAGVRVVGKGHCQLRLQGPGKTALAAIAFRAVEKGFAPILAAHAESAKPLHVAGRLEIDDWGGRRKAKLHVEDIAVPDE